MDYKSHAAALDRNELGALLVAAGLGLPPEHALISLLALNGLRVSEATGADIEHLGLERGHRTLTITRKGGKVVTIPLAPRTARAIDLAIGERTGGPVFLAADGRRLDRHGAGRVVRRTARRAGIGTPPTSSPPTSQAPPGNAPAGTASPGGQLPGEADPARRSGHFPVVTPCDPRVNGNRYERQQESRCSSAGAHRTDIRRALPRAGVARAAFTQTSGLTAVQDAGV